MVKTILYVLGIGVVACVLAVSVLVLLEHRVTPFLLNEKKIVHQCSLSKITPFCSFCFSVLFLKFGFILINE